LHVNYKSAIFKLVISAKRFFWHTGKLYNSLLRLSLVFNKKCGLFMPNTATRGVEKFMRAEIMRFMAIILYSKKAIK